MLVVPPPPQKPGKAAVVGISAGYGKIAVIEADDYEALVALGAPSQWSFRRGRVGYGHPIWPRQFVQIGRILMGCQAGQGARHRDLDPLNLRRPNLERCTADISTCPVEELVDGTLAERLKDATERQRLAVQKFLSRLPTRTAA